MLPSQEPKIHIGQANNSDHQPENLDITTTNTVPEILLELPLVKQAIDLMPEAKRDLLINCAQVKSAIKSPEWLLATLEKAYESEVVLQANFEDKQKKEREALAAQKQADGTATTAMNHSRENILLIDKALQDRDFWYQLQESKIDKAFAEYPDLRPQYEEFISSEKAQTIINRPKPSFFEKMIISGPALRPELGLYREALEEQKQNLSSKVKLLESDIEKRQQKVSAITHSLTLTRGSFESLDTQLIACLSKDVELALSKVTDPFERVVAVTEMLRDFTLPVKNLKASIEALQELRDLASWEISPSYVEACKERDAIVAERVKLTTEEEELKNDEQQSSQGLSTCKTGESARDIARDLRRARYRLNEINETDMPNFLQREEACIKEFIKAEDFETRRKLISTNEHTGDELLRFSQELLGSTVGTIAARANDKFIEHALKAVDQVYESMECVVQKIVLEWINISEPVDIDSESSRLYLKEFQNMGRAAIVLKLHPIINRHHGEWNGSNRYFDLSRYKSQNGAIENTPMTNVLPKTIQSREEDYRFDGWGRTQQYWMPSPQDVNEPILELALTAFSKHAVWEGSYQDDRYRIKANISLAAQILSEDMELKNLSW